MSLLEHPQAQRLLADAQVAAGQVRGCRRGNSFEIPAMSDEIRSLATDLHRFTRISPSLSRDTNNLIRDTALQALTDAGKPLSNRELQLSRRSLAQPEEIRTDSHSCHSRQACPRAGGGWESRSLNHEGHEDHESPQEEKRDTALGTARKSNR
jgi:hypothetical protein